MELLQLVYFCTAAETENFAEAAKKCGVPAASISHSVKRLETELGIPLFNRRANSVELSERGRAFYLKVRSGLDMLSDAESEARDERVAGKIKILAVTHASVIDRAVADFCERYPDVTFQVDHVKREHLGKYDIIVTDNAPFKEGYVRERFIEEPLLAAVPLSHPFSAKESLCACDLKNESLVLFNDGSGMLSMVNRICARERFAYKFKIQTDDEHSLVEYVERGLGIAIIPATMAGNLDPQKVMCKAITDMTRISVLCYHGHKYKTKAVSLFFESLKDALKEYEAEIQGIKAQIE